MYAPSSYELLTEHQIQQVVSTSHGREEARAIGSRPEAERKCRKNRSNAEDVAGTGSSRVVDDVESGACIYWGREVEVEMQPSNPCASDRSENNEVLEGAIAETVNSGVVGTAIVPATE